MTDRELSRLCDSVLIGELPAHLRGAVQCLVDAGDSVREILSAFDAARLDRKWNLSERLAVEALAERLVAEREARAN